MDDEYYCENEITKTLDAALRDKKSVMISGLTGSGKTAITNSWLEHNKDKINGYYIDSAFIRAFSGEKRVKNGLTLLGQVFTDQVIDNLLSLPHRVVVVDNYHLLSADLKYHILLLTDGYVVDGREKSGFKKIDNLEFVCLIKTEGL